jgi:hypothetical protein
LVEAQRRQAVGQLFVLGGELPGDPVGLLGLAGLLLGVGLQLLVLLAEQLGEAGLPRAAGGLAGLGQLAFEIAGALAQALVLGLEQLGGLVGDGRAP